MGKVAFARVLKDKWIERKRSEQSCVWEAVERQSFQKHPVSWALTPAWKGQPFVILEMPFKVNLDPGWTPGSAIQ